MRLVREAIAGVRRAPLLSGLSISSIGLSLFIVGMFALAAHNLDAALAELESRVEVVAFLADDVPEERLRIARAEIEAFPEVSGVTFVSKVEALFNASRDLTEFSDVYSDLEVNPLPSSFEVGLRPRFRNPDATRAVAERLTSYAFVTDVRYGQEWVDRLFAVRRIAGGAAFMLGGGFAVGAALLIAIAVRMAVLARATEIAVMRIVGATDSYIRRPFVFEGLLTGLAGGVLALGLTFGGYVLVDRSLIALGWLPDLWVAGGLAVAVLLGVSAAGLAVRRELRGIDVA